MVKVSYLVARFSSLEREVRALNKSLKLTMTFEANSFQGLLSLNKAQFNVIVALNVLGKADASQVSKFLGIQRAMVSGSLNELWRMKFIERKREGRTCYFVPLLVLKELRTEPES